MSFRFGRAIGLACAALAFLAACPGPCRAGRRLAAVARAAPGRHLAGDGPAQGMAQGGPPATVEGSAVRRLLVGGRGRWPRVHADQGEGPGGRRLPRRRHRQGCLALPLRLRLRRGTRPSRGEACRPREPARARRQRLTPAASTPSGATGILLCLEAKTGKKVWQQDLPQALR